NVSQDAFESGVDEFEERSTIGFTAGIFTELPLGDAFSIAPELLWVQKGGKTEFTNVLGAETERNTRYNYIEVPILAKVKAGNTDGTGVGLFFYGGPFISYALNGNIRTEIGETETETDINFDDTDNTRRVDWGAAFGLGVGIGPMMLDLRYDLGINNLLDDDIGTGGANDDEPYLRTRAIALTLGFLLGGNR
ncbi:MAG: porin family protein, partial [Saprospiraceae bacterium]